MRFKRPDKSVIGAVALHLLVVAAMVLTVSSQPPQAEQQSMAVDIVSSTEVAKPRVEKVSKEKTPDNNVGKIAAKPPVITEAAPEVQEKPVEKPPEKKPEPPKPEVEKAAKPKVNDVKDDSKIDPMAELIKKDQAKKPVPKPEAKAKPAPPPPQQMEKKEMRFDQLARAALINKQDPTRQAATGETLNPTPSSGLTKGRDNSATWGAMFKSQVERCWKKPYGGIEAQVTEAIFSVKLRQDGSLETTPASISNPSTPYFRVYQESALRAIIECQPYKLPTAFFDEWKFFEPVFTERRS